MKLQLFKPQQQSKATVTVGSVPSGEDRGKNAAFVKVQFGMLKKRHIAPPVRLIKL